MEVNTNQNLVDDPESLIRERFFVKAEHPDDRSRKRSSVRKSSTRPSHDDPVPADKYTSCKLDEPVRLQISDKGALAQRPITVVTALQLAADKYQDSDAFAVNVNGKWQKTKVRDMYSMVRTAAKGFIRLGLQRFHGVVIMGFNAPEWVVSYLAAIFAGGVVVGIHYDLTAEECQRAILCVQCNIIVVDSGEELDKILQIRYNLPDLLTIVHYGADESQKTPGVISWKELLEMGEQSSEDKLKESILSQASNHCCAVAFTTGRTGPPKAIMMSHDNVIWPGRAFGKYQSLSSSGGIHVSFLPLNQPTGVLLDIIIPLIYATTVYFVPRKVFKQKLMEVIRKVRPTFLASSPRFYAKVADHLQVSFDKGVIRRSMIKMAMNIGRKTYLNANEGKPRPFGWWLANHFVFKKVRRQLGLDRCLEIHSGRIHMLDETAEFFISFGMLILNVYATAEMCGPHTASLTDRHRLGSCGVEMDGCRTKFAPIDHTVYNELRVKGRHVFMGYLNEPQMTKDAFDEDGWYKTTDIGYRDESGFLWITGGISDLFKLTDGRIVAPVPIEMAVKNRLPCMSHCIAYGQKRPYVIMLFTLQALTNTETNIPLDVLSKKAELWFRKKNVEVSPISQMVASPPENLVSIIQSVIDQVNANVLDFMTSIKRWKLLPRDFSIPTGELSLTYSEKRSVIHELYATTIEELYVSR